MIGLISNQDRFQQREVFVAYSQDQAGKGLIKTWAPEANIQLSPQEVYLTAKTRVCAKSYYQKPICSLN
ncbi:hypothetical protein FGO68_gene12163 [Halteria grandinella]|uniref:Uncharacterized protein n=1 Tax=Halteria grandinella TaxID=5974 RepID=A0A8J8NWL7_HALGN|nr:hypothetical protein FGO68_gene12163 [Halteria grandinella]